MSKLSEAPGGLIVIFVVEIIGVVFLMTDLLRLSFVLGFPEFDHVASVLYNVTGIFWNSTICIGIYGGKCWLRKMVVYWLGYYILAFILQALFWLVNWNAVAEEINMNDLSLTDAWLIVGLAFLIILGYQVWAATYIYGKKEYFDGK